jgi:hypothetical protein
VSVFLACERVLKSVTTRFGSHLKPFVGTVQFVHLCHIVLVLITWFNKNNLGGQVSVLGYTTDAVDLVTGISEVTIL